MSHLYVVHAVHKGLKKQLADFRLDTAIGSADSVHLSREHISSPWLCEGRLPVTEDGFCSDFVLAISPQPSAEPVRSRRLNCSVGSLEAQAEVLASAQRVELQWFPNARIGTNDICQLQYQPSNAAHRRTLSTVKRMDHGWQEEADPSIDRDNSPQCAFFLRLFGSWRSLGY